MNLRGELWNHQSWGEPNLERIWPTSLLELPTTLLFIQDFTKSLFPLLMNPYHFFLKHKNYPSPSLTPSYETPTSCRRPSPKANFHIIKAQCSYSYIKITKSKVSPTFSKGPMLFLLSQFVDVLAHTIDQFITQFKAQAILQITVITTQFTQLQILLHLAQLLKIIELMVR